MRLEAAVPYAGSLVLHAVILALFAIGASFVRQPEIVQPLPVEAVVVDQQVIEALTRERREADLQARALAARR